MAPNELNRLIAKDLIEKNPELAQEVYRQMKRAEVIEDLLSSIFQNANIDISVGDISEDRLEELGDKALLGLKENIEYDQKYKETLNEIVTEAL